MTKTHSMVGWRPCHTIAPQQRQTSARPSLRRTSTGLNAIADLRKGKVTFILNDPSVFHDGGVLDHPLRLDIAFQPSIVLARRSEEHTSELQSRLHLVCRLLLEKKNEA